MLRSRRRLGAFIVAVTAVVALVVLTSRGQAVGASGIASRVAFIGLLSYLLTFAIWPRRARHTHASAPQVSVERPQRPVVDHRPVAIIQSRPAGSRPASRVHIPESPTARNPRGRRRETRQSSGDFRWPAQK